MVSVFSVSRTGSILDEFRICTGLTPPVLCKDSVPLQVLSFSVPVLRPNDCDSFSTAACSVIRHYLTFARQADILDRQVAGQILAECWSQEKNRVLLRFIEGTASFFVEISLDLQVGYALPLTEIHRARKNTLDFFQSLLGARLDSIEMHESERLMRMNFAGGRILQIFFFGPGAGNILLTDGEKVLDSFHEFGDEYSDLLTGEDDEDIHTRDEFIAQLRASEDTPLRALSSVLRRLGKRLTVEALFRAEIAETESFASIARDRIVRLLDTVDRLYDEGTNSDTFRLYYTRDDLIFSLVRLEHLENEELEKTEEFDSLAKAIRVYRGTSFRRGRFRSLQGKMAKQLEKEIRRQERSLGHAGKSGQHAERADEWETIGNVLLSNLHVIERGQEQVELADWEGNPLVIKLDPKISPADNAERFFRKARGARNEIEHAARRAAMMREQLQILGLLERKVAAAEKVETLEEIRNHNTKIFQVKGEAKEKGSAERFRRFIVDGGFEVYTGKSAANNDELTLRFARPNDIWLHARGTSGSHVVLRWSDTKSRPPKRTLQEAAMIAAYYSGAKNSKLVPVAWTFKKYVRKPKGAAPGSVVMGREEVVMVEPRIPGDE